jgi:hypothetical protein
MEALGFPSDLLPLRLGEGDAGLPEEGWGILEPALGPVDGAVVVAI